MAEDKGPAWHSTTVTGEVIDGNPFLASLERLIGRAQMISGL